MSRPLDTPAEASRAPEGAGDAARSLPTRSRSVTWAVAVSVTIVVSLSLLVAAWALRAIETHFVILVIGMLVMLLLLQMEGTVMLSRETDERKRLETRWRVQAAELERSNQGLAHRERVMRSLLEDLQLSKERLESQARALQLANARLEELSVVKDELIAKVSHELRTPLTSIKEGLSLLLDNALGETNAEQQDFLQTMDGDVDRLAEFINSMLDISKIEAGRMRLARQAVDLRQLVESTIVSCHPLVGGRTIRVDGEAVPPVFADANRIRQVVTNLLSNALKYTPEDGTVVFRFGRRDGMAALAVEDNGPGMAPEDLPKLFHKFSQVGHHTVGGRRGTGLGLVVCKELVELHRGRIDVVSELGRGTTFTVLLPVYDDTLALRESFQDLRELAPPGSGQTVGLVAIQAGPVREARGRIPHDRDTLERLADDVRRHVHQGDLVLVLEPSWVVVLAATDALGLKAIVNRLSQRLRGERPLQFGVAVSPDDGTEAVALCERAMERVGQGAALGPPSPTDPRSPHRSMHVDAG